MSKFGELIDIDCPVLLNFYTEWHTSTKETQSILKDVATAIGSNGKVIRIDIDKNPALAEALHIKTLPTFMIYKSGEMKWRQSGIQNAEILKDLMQTYA